MKREGSKKSRRASKQERAHLRLEHLYKISKALATFENVEKGFPRLLSLAAGAFPLLSAVLIERRGEIPKTTIWPTTGLDEGHVKTVISRARGIYSYLAGSSPSQALLLMGSAATENKLQGEEYAKRSTRERKDRFFALPLVLGRKSVLGVLQLEAQEALNEEDLSFVDALTHLIAVALDNYYRAADEREIQKLEQERHLALLSLSEERTKTESLRLLRSQKQVTKLEEEQELRERFVSALSHDLKTPLTAATMSAQLILRAPDNAPNCRLLAGKIVSDLDRIERMIDDLLDAGRMRAGERLRLDLALCDLLVVATDTIGMLKAIHGNRFRLDVDRSEVWGYWSADGLRRVIENLATNAIKYGRSDTPVTIILRQSEKGVRLAVHNEGDPIPLRDQPGLFRQFRRTGSAQSGRKSGWGLGLAVVRGVVEAHGGKVSIESSAGRGTTFVVELPNDSRGLGIQVSA